MGLFDCAMIKDNHIVAAGSVAGAIDAVNARASPSVPIQVEVETRGAGAGGARRGRPLPHARQHDARRDGASLVTAVREREAERRQGVRSRRRAGSRWRTRAMSPATGVDFMSVGALTHS